MLWFYCDESYDQPTRTYCVAGLLGDEQTLTKLETNWQGINARFGVSRFHATHLNGFKGEFKPWADNKNKQVQYSKRCLKAIQKRGKKLCLTAIAMEADEYKKHLSEESRIRFGHPYIACFKTCVLMIAIHMRNMPDEFAFSVIFERNEHSSEALRVFNLLKQQNPEIGKRLGTCASGRWDKQIALQPSDLVAYETMRMLQSKRSNGTMRIALNTLFGVNSSLGWYFDGPVLASLKEVLELSTVDPGSAFFRAREFYPEYVDGDDWEDVERKVAENDRKREAYAGMDKPI